MSGRAELLTSALLERHASLIETVESASDREWELLCEENGRELGQLARHVVDFLGLVPGFLQAIADGKAPPPITYSWIHEANAASAASSKSQTKVELLEQLRKAGRHAAEVVGGFTDQQLRMPWEIIVDAGSMSIETAIKKLLIEHEGVHLATMRAAIDRLTSSTAI